MEIIYFFFLDIIIGNLYCSGVSGNLRVYIKGKIED